VPELPRPTKNLGAPWPLGVLFVGHGQPSPVAACHGAWGGGVAIKASAMERSVIAMRVRQPTGNEAQGTAQSVFLRAHAGPRPDRPAMKREATRVRVHSAGPNGRGRSWSARPAWSNLRRMRVQTTRVKRGQSVGMSGLLPAPRSRAFCFSRALSHGRRGPGCRFEKRVHKACKPLVHMDYLLA
jgi:hypothetical protein